MCGGGEGETLGVVKELTPVDVPPCCVRLTGWYGGLLDDWLCGWLADWLFGWVGDWLFAWVGG